MAGEKPQRVSIGFVGSQVMTGRVAPEELAKLRDALGSEGWRDVRFDDGTAAIDLSKVVYVLVEDEEHRVGFGAQGLSLPELDRKLLLLARTRGHARWAERGVSAYSRTGEHAACWIALGLVNGWRRGVRVVAASYALNYLVKVAVRRPRPELPGLPPLTPTVSRLSFPSAHATTSFAAARAYGREAAPGPLYAAALAFAVSRPYLGVHYPSDVLAGAILGTLVAEVWPA